MGSLFCLLLAGIICLIPEIIIYNKSPKLIPNDSFDKREFLYSAIYILAIIFWGILLNIIFTKTGLIGISQNYNSAKNVLSDGSLPIKIMCNCIVIPILEELLYRGIICGQMSLFTNPVVATLFSSFCFGFLHFNIVQFIYAFLVGLSLGYVYCKSKRLWIVILAHGLTNLIVILFT